MESIEKAQKKLLEIMAKDLREKAFNQKAITCIHENDQAIILSNGKKVIICLDCLKVWLLLKLEA